MGDVNRASSIAKNIQKHAGRAKELFRQNLGKADKTTDEEINEFVKNFSKQQYAASRLSKEVKNYQNCVKALQVASKTLTDVICDLYEPNWVEHDKVQVQADVLEKKFEDYHATINEQVIKPLIAYSEQFPDMHQKILKRRRKLLDYDSCRHTIQNLEQNPRRRDEAKIAKAREQLAEKRNLYEAINSELLEELPALYDSRISFLASNLQCLFIAEATFHSETSKIFSELNDAVEALAAENQKGIYSTKKQERRDSDPTVSANECSTSQGVNVSEADRSSSSEYFSAETFTGADGENKANENVTPTPEQDDDDQENPDASAEKFIKASAENHGNHEEKPESSVAPAATHSAELPPGVLYQVQATFQYIAEDADELSFEAGDIINVTEFEDPEQKEDGWLMGYKTDTGVKGLFPANFTKLL